MHPIKTITLLMKCLNVDIPIFKTVFEVEIKVPRIVLYKQSLLELLEAVGNGTYYTKINKEAIQHYAEVCEAHRKAEKEKEKIAKVTCAGV